VTHFVTCNNKSDLFADSRSLMFILFDRAYVFPISLPL